ncbi:MAG: ATP-binding protein [Bacteroidetes bacterium]|nr:ATP-binding protein [Bacteroidota bacterium]
MKRVAVTGPESTGKSMLAKKLAEHFQTVWVPEYAREYLEKKQSKYDLDDILNIAMGQLEREEKMVANADHFIFCDTELLVTKIWAEHAFGHCPAWIRENLTAHLYDLYLLCDIDLPWEADPLREHPHLRDYFFNLYAGELDAMGVSYAVVRGMHEERFECAINHIRYHFNL